MSVVLKHPFEYLAPGPYTFAGLIDASEIRVQMAMAESIYDKPEPGACIGSCDHCNAAITIAVRLKGSDGTIFKVGETCAKKAFSPGVPVLSEVTQACNKRRTSLRNAKIAAEFDRCLAWADKNDFTKQPHPKGYERLNLADYLEWYQKNAGKKKFVEICKSVGFQ